MEALPPRRREPGAPVGCAVVTISDSRTEEEDVAGTLARDRLHEAGHAVEFYRIVPDDPEKIRGVLVHLAGRVEAVLTTGGTGIAARDRTIEVAEPLITKPLPGFGELFRALAFAEVGPVAMRLRAVGGVYAAPSEPEAGASLLFCCPGSPQAVALALDRLIIPELPRLVWETLRQRAEPA